MRIGIEAERANNRIKTGVEHYAKQLILGFAQANTKDQFILYLRSQPEDWIKQLPKNFSYKVMPFPKFWTTIRLSLEMLLHPPDVLFIPASSMPLIHPKKTVVTVHDLAFLYYPDTYTYFTRNFHTFEDWLVKKFAWKIIAVSASTKNDLVKEYGINPERITVVHHGYESAQSANIKYQTSNIKNEIQEKLPKQYVLFLSTLQPRKNLEGLILAFRELKDEHPELPHKLVVVGKPGWKFEKILETIEAHKDVVVYLHYVSDADRSLVLSRASALVLPSFYEGFGMQILESFDAGIPVVTSSVSSMPEIAGEAAEYCDPHSRESIKKALRSVLLDAARAEQLASAGKERLKQFSWEKCARETLTLLHQKQ